MTTIPTPIKVGEIVQSHMQARKISKDGIIYEGLKDGVDFNVE